jgi:hypothetical protein
MSVASCSILHENLPALCLPQVCLMHLGVAAIKSVQRVWCIASHKSGALLHSGFWSMLKRGAVARVSPRFTDGWLNYLLATAGPWLA